MSALRKHRLPCDNKQVKGGILKWEKTTYTQRFKEDQTVRKSAPTKARVSIIGCGWIAAAHIKAYLAQPDVEIVAGRPYRQAAAFFKKHGVEGLKPTMLAQEMLDDKSLGLDAVALAAYTASTAPAIYALEGVNVLRSLSTLDEAWRL